ncbi:hypothetical protein EIP86_002228 [Pleurotus ostreatoroseus]|nr:hypothetical protein EIP86_002228 [Pleurotus ostreatoroseus]
MSTAALRTVAKHTTRITRGAGIRSPFAILAAGEHSSPLTSAPAANANVSPIHVYEKQDGFHLNHASISSSGQRVYVVSEPDPRSTPYEVPYGAYPTYAPYVNFPVTDAPPSGQRASTSPNFAHSTTTRAAPQNPSGVRESSAVRAGEAPGEMHQRGGSFGGLGLMDKASTTPGEGELASRNPQPDDSRVAEKFSSMGVDNAWKARKWTLHSW